MLEDATFHGSTVLLLVILAAATWTDLNYHRIPNVLSLGGMILGIALHGWTAGFPGFVTGLGGTVVGMAIFLPFYLAHGMGAGDVKLMGAAGSFLGPMNALLATGLSLAAGGVIAIIILLVRGGLGALLKRYGSTLKCFIYSRKIVYPPASVGDVAAMKFPYAAAIGIGTVVTLWWTNELQELTDFLFSLIR